jgi:hypothetical protein
MSDSPWASWEGIYPKNNNAPETGGIALSFFESITSLNR